MTDESSSALGGPRLILATDGSGHANAALVAGLRLLGGASECVLVTAVPGADPGLVVGTGHSGPVMTPSERDELESTRYADAQDILREAATLLSEQGGGGVLATQIIEGDPGEAICRTAADLDAAGIVMGTHGQGGLKRALLGSVSDHVVRHAPCPVVTVNPTSWD